MPSLLDGTIQGSNSTSSRSFQGHDCEFLDVLVWSECIVLLLNLELSDLWAIKLVLFSLVRLPVEISDCKENEEPNDNEQD